MGLETKNNYAGKGQQKFTRQTSQSRAKKQKNMVMGPEPRMNDSAGKSQHHFYPTDKLIKSSVSC
jgi:hypothetical protein